MEDILNEFGKILIKEVRDNVINSMNESIDGKRKGIAAQLIKKKNSYTKRGAN